MPNFNAGAIEASLTLDRSPFTQGIRLAREQARRLQDSRITLTADVDRSEFDRLQNDINDMDGTTVTINTDVDAARTREQMAVLTRPRRVSIWVNIANLTRARAQLASLGRITMALSGANVIVNRLRTIRDQLENLDKLAYRAGGLTYLFGNLSNVILTASANTWTLIGSIGQLGGLLIPVVAYMGSLASAAGVLAIAFTGWDTGVKAMQDIQNALKEITPAWNALLKEVRSTFWDGLAEPFKNLADTVLPHLHDGLVSTAGAMNDWARQWMAGLANIDGGVWDNIFGGIASSITIANQSIQPLINAFATLGNVGSDNLDRLSQWFVDISNRFNNFITAAAADGRLQQWVDNGAQAFMDLGRVLGQLGGIFNGVAEAFKAAGSTSLGTLADTLTRIHEIIDTPTFQQGLSTIFAGMISGASFLTQALGPVGDMLAALAPTIGYLASQIGQVLGGAITAIAGALSSPVFATGLTAFFDGIAAGINGLIPYLPDIVQGIAAIGQVAGAILANVGPALGALLGGIGSALAEAMPSLMIVVDVLGGALMSVIEALVPALNPVISAIAGLLAAFAPIIPALLDALIPAFVSLISSITPLITTALIPLMNIIAQAAPLIGTIMANAFMILAGLVQALSPVLTALVQVVMQLFTAFSPLLPVIIQIVQVIGQLAIAFLPLITTILMPLVDLIADLASELAPLVPSLMQLAMAVLQVVTALLPLVQMLMPLLIQIIQTVIPIITFFASLLSVVLVGAVRAVSAVISQVAGVLSSFAGGIRSMTEAVKGQIGSMVESVTGIKNKVTSAFSDAQNWLKDAARRVVDGFIDGVKGAFGRVRDTFQGLTNLIPDWKGPASRDKVLLKGNANLIMGGFIDQIEVNRSALRRKLGEVTKDIRLGGTAEGAIGVRAVTGGGAAGQPGGTVIQAGAIQATVNVPNGMNEEQVGTHVAAKFGHLLSSGATPVLQPVVG